MLCPTQELSHSSRDTLQISPGNYRGFIQDFLVWGRGGEKFVGHCHSVIHEKFSSFKYDTIQISSFLGGGGGGIPGPPPSV